MSTKQPAKQPTTAQGHLLASALIALIITVLVAIIQYLALKQLDWQTLALVLGSLFVGAFIRVYAVFQNPASPQTTADTQNELLNFLSQQFGDIFQRMREVERATINHTHSGPSLPPVPMTPPPAPQPIVFPAKPWSATSSAVPISTPPADPKQAWTP